MAATCARQRLLRTIRLPCPPPPSRSFTSTSSSSFSSTSSSSFSSTSSSSFSSTSSSSFSSTSSSSFSSSSSCASYSKHNSQHRKQSFRSRLTAALGKTRIKWEPIPIALGIGFLGAFQLYRIQRREKHSQAEDTGADEAGQPKKRQRIRPSGPWSVQVMSTLPLKALSRLWGRFNEIDIPYYFRVPGFRLYSFIFGVNLSEVAEPDLHVYPNLAAFFYRTLKPGARPLDPNPNAVLSPADGKIIQFGLIEHGEVEQVKGVTYSLDALLGSNRPSNPVLRTAGSQPPSSTHQTPPSADQEEIVRADEEFANVNGISYTLPNLFSGPWPKGSQPAEMPTDQSTKPTSSSESAVRADLALRDPEIPWWAPAPADASSTKPPTALYYCVVYLAPGDYHRFHSPVSWVVESRRHFAGELYSVSPYLQRTLPGLFTLNERVVLLGRWRHGFFSYTPVGATNVGSIKVNFDAELRTNSLTTDTAADRAAELAIANGQPYSGFAEASYANASPVLHGHALKRGEEMGGFQLGSTIVLVFEAPKGDRPSLDEGFQGRRHGGFRWLVKQGMKVKVGEALGLVDEHEQ